MAYIDDDQSVHDGQPVELYEFEGPTAALTYHYTSYTESVSYGGDTYLPEPLMRSSIDVASGGDIPELSIEMPITLDLVQEYGFQTPPRSLTLRIYRRHTVTGVAQKVWEGVVTSVAVTGSQASIRSSSTMDDALAAKIPSAYFQVMCNHMLYDDMCQVSRSPTFDESATVSAISGDSIQVSTVGGKPNNYFKAGEIVRDTDGERRLILQQLSTTLILNKAFRTLVVTDAVTMYAGCDHTIDTCKSKFSNVVNFGGQPNLPDKDPYIVGFDNLLGEE